MYTFENYNPAAVFVCFASVISVAMFCSNPFISAISLFGAVSLFVARNGAAHMKSHGFFILMFAAMALINPIFYHNGVTVLFVVNDNPVTLEALLYGLSSSAAVVSVMYWFRSFSQIMTGDKLLYLFGSVSPKTALILSMAMRYVPLFGEQAKKVGRTQKALGLFKEDNIIDDIRGGARVFSVMVTWALENGIITADSMAARGYGTGRRSFFSLFKFRKRDAALTCLSLALAASAVAGIAGGALAFEFYPAVSVPPFSAGAAAAYICYGALALLPAANEAAEGLKWMCLRSRA